MDVRDALLQRVNRRMMRMREALDRFDDESAEREMVGPRWNVRDLVGHFVYWTGESARGIPKLAAGTLSKGYDIDRINDEVYRKYRRMSFVMLLPQLREAEDLFIQALRSVQPSLLVGETDVREWIDTSIKHYDTHWPGLKAAAGRLE